MVNTVRPDSDLETVKPSAVCCTLMSIFFGIFLARCPSCTRRDRKVTVTTSAIKVAPTANQRRKRETNRGIYCQFTRRGGNALGSGRHTRHLPELKRTRPAIPGNRSSLKPALRRQLAALEIILQRYSECIGHSIEESKHGGDVHGFGNLIFIPPQI